MPGKPTVVYIMSDVRSGSTLLENILSKSEESVSVGEMALLKNHIFRRGAGFRWNWNCSCGKLIPDCPFWSVILKDMDTDSEQFHTAVQWNFKSKKMLAGSLFSSFVKKRIAQINGRSINKEVVTTNIQLYRNIFAQTGKAFIIDSSKDPVQAYITYLNKPPDYDVKIISLQRDLRAIAASKNKWNQLNEAKHKSLGKLLTNSLLYKKICNAVVHLVPQEDVVSVHYEDLAVQTQVQLEKVLQTCGMKFYQAPVMMGVDDDHTIAGTPQRFTQRPITYDDSWKQAYKKKPVLSVLGKIMNTM